MVIAVLWWFAILLVVLGFGYLVLRGVDKSSLEAPVKGYVSMVIYFLMVVWIIWRTFVLFALLGHPIA